ncbi:MAG: hypothetical protein M3N98_06165 [Actinomycetota bacterium]|nr:hypothetical protein [Actinomycetota bacterium]
MAPIVALVAAKQYERAGQSPPGPRQSRMRATTSVAIVGLAMVFFAGCSSSSRPTATAAITTTTAALPVDISVNGSTRLKDGQGVTVHVTAKSGSQIFGFEARLCAGSDTFQFDADMRPTLKGKCITKPLSAGSDAYQEVRASAPYLMADSVFHVGVGTDQFTMENNTPLSITCGPGHPCQLVLKVQYPNGFAIRAFPLTYG